MHPAPVHNDQTHVVVLCVWGAPAWIRFCGVRACGTWVASGAFHGVELYGRTGSALRTTSTGSVRSAECLRAFPPRHNKKNLTQPPSDKTKNLRGCLAVEGCARSSSQSLIRSSDLWDCGFLPGPSWSFPGVVNHIWEYIGTRWITLGLLLVP